MAIRKEYTPQTVSPEETKQEILDILIHHEVQSLIFELESDDEWIIFFRTHPGWKVTSDDDQIVSFECANSGKQVC